MPLTTEEAWAIVRQAEPALPAWLHRFLLRWSTRYRYRYEYLVVHVVRELRKGWNLP